MLEWRPRWVLWIALDAYQYNEYYYDVAKSLQKMTKKLITMANQQQPNWLKIYYFSFVNYEGYEQRERIANSLAQ